MDQEQAIAEWIKHVERMGTTFETVSKELSSYNAEINKGKRSILTLGPTLKKMKEALDDQNDALQDTTLSEEDRKKTTDAVNKAQVAYSNTLKQFVGAQVMKGLADSLVNGGRAFLLGSRDMAFSGIRSMQAGSDSIAAASEAFALEMERNANMIKAPLQAIAAAGAELPAKLGIAAELAGKAGIALVDASVTLTKEGINALNTELTKTKIGFTSLSNAGAFFANGMTGMRNSAAAAGLRLDDYVKTVQNSSDSLRLFGRDQADAMAMVGKVTNTMGTEVNNQLRKLGFSQMEIAEGTAEYMANLARTGSLAGRSQGQLAKESEGYLTNLKLISSITGEDAKAAQKRAMQASMQSAVQSELAAMGGEATAKFQNLVKVLPGLDNEIMQIMKTGTTNNAAILNSPIFDIIKNGIAGVRDQAVGADDIINNAQNSLKAAGPAIQAIVAQFEGAGVGQLFGINSPFATALQGLTNILPQTKRSADDIRTALNAQKTTTDTVTDETVRLQKQFENASIMLEKTLTPSLAGFATQLQDTFKNVEKYVEQALKLMVSKSGARTTIPDGAAPQERSPGGGYEPGGGLAQDETNIAAATGAVLTGPASGYKPNLTMHGTEAIVPLAGGAVPVKSPELRQVIDALKGISTNNSAEINNTSVVSNLNLAPLIEKMAENNQLLRTQLEMNRQIADKLETGNSNTKGILSYAR